MQQRFRYDLALFLMKECKLRKMGKNIRIAVAIQVTKSDTKRFW